jgi:hypothetical protein
MHLFISAETKYSPSRVMQIIQNSQEQQQPKMLKMNSINKNDGKR